MKKRIHSISFVFVLLLLLCTQLVACGGDSDKDTTNQTTLSTEKGSRDNTPVVLIPEASGTSIESCDSVTIDLSNTSEGYFMVEYVGTVEKVKLQVTGPYLYPNQYVNFTAESLPIDKAVDLAYPANNDLEVVENVYNYMISNFTYDYDKADSVVSGYLPVVDDIYKSNTGICFDYAAVMATMLRSQNIPTRLEVGYVGETYHAWISTYIQDVGWINGIIEFNGSTWSLLDPTFASTSKNPTDFITEDSTYLTKYVY